jgi:hypothetical protein
VNDHVQSNTPTLDIDECFSIELLVLLNSSHTTQGEGPLSVMRPYLPDNMSPDDSGHDDGVRIDYHGAPILVGRHDWSVFM